MKILLSLSLSLALATGPGILSVSAQTPLSATESKIVKSIEVKGNNTISIATILSKIKTRVGQEYLQAVISDDLKRLYNTGYFSDVRVDRENYEGGLKVIIYLEEKPVVEEITFSKLRYVKKRSILSKIQTQEGKFLDKKSLNDDINTIKDMYAKKGLTQATVDVETFVDEATNRATLHFIVREGFRVKVKKINVYGNTAYSDSKLIKVMKSRTAWLFNSGYLKKDVLEEDMNRVEAFYEQNGYIDARAAYNVEELYKGLVHVNVNVDEGRRYYIGDVSIVGNAVVSDNEIFAKMEHIEKGNIFSREKLAEDVNKISSMYFDRGYIFAGVEESTSLNTESGKVDVKLDIKEGGIAYINKIKIQGNTRTRDVVIRRELRMFPGDQFDGDKLRRSKERLRNLDYFEDVSFDMESTGSTEHKNLVVQVKEAKTGSFSFGGGYSTVDEVVGFVEISQRNFDITNWPTFTGAGQNLQLRAETGSTRNNLRLSFTEPWIMDYPISGGFDLYRLERDRERDVGYAYDETRTGGNVRFGKELLPDLTGGVNYRWESVEIGNLLEDTLDNNGTAGIQDDERYIIRELAAEEGENAISSIGMSLTMDKRDSIISPTKGWVLNGQSQLAGGLIGGDRDFYRLETRGSYYVPMFLNSVLEFRVRAGVVDAYGDSSSVPIFERYFAGGAKSIRGYDERAVGPQARPTNTSGDAFPGSDPDPIGGEALLVGNIEYTIPVIEFLKLAAFVDSGNVWGTVEDMDFSDFKSGTGFGLRIKTPIGPVNLDYGIPLTDIPDDDGDGKFYFSISRGF